ncbi:Disease resistance protein (TIR-NBS-LRR class) family [Melia azedarach]|uniref:Disease resistance protein (TIR-NBS-LRR class) family n=1 Tax=Melia azedarach TaxID=155640 RepID=A0ACC1YK68_MELAZ|nr:Disease resistance protein (TIR-NBS-LRR class) family [Melia azedarach]
MITLMASSSSSIPQTKYDVFLSFKGEDTRDNFTSHLYSTLRRKQIQTFIDNQLVRGDKISPSIFNAIEGSNISVIIFSEGYASSRWCLDELVKILECKNLRGQIVMPVFYRVDPSDVRNQTGIFGDLFSKLEECFHEKLDKLQSWRIALREAANLSGFDSHVIRPESELIEKIINNILRKLKDKLESHGEEHLMGVESYIREIESLLSIGSTGVYTLGIWGMGGIGKTTITRAIFKKAAGHFDGSCFMENVREGEEKNKGLVHLRQQLFSTLLEDENVKIDVLDNSFNLQRLRRKKVFIVFDDITCLKQIESLIGNLYHIGEGSRIIITTRDKQVLKICKVNEIYKMKGLLQRDALELFSQCAFKKNHPNIGYDELSFEIIEYAGGIPLALKVLGCFLLGKKKKVWRSAIEKLKRIPNKDIQKVLKISYDGLDDEEQNIFLDIACFFKGEDKDYITTFLDGCGFFAKIGIRILVDKCLIIISKNSITMHDLLQEMGREIVRQESINDPGKRSRLWHHEDIYEVLTYNMGTKTVQGISFDMSTVEKIHLNPYVFTKMRKLRYLKFYGENKCKLSHFFDSRFSEVRYFRWDGYPVKSFPLRSHSSNLVSLELRDSRIEELWDGIKNLVKLKHIDLSNSKQLIELPDLSKAPNLEKLILEGCSSLVDTHSSIQLLNKLVIMDLRNCESLKRLPPIICTESLKTLLLSGCTSLKRFTEISSIDYPSKLVKLDLRNCSRLEHLPRSIGKLKSLQRLNLSYCSKLQRLPDELGNLEALKTLDIERTPIREIPESLGQLSSLKELYLEKNNFERIPESIINLSNLKELSLSYCKRLRYLPKLPCNLYYVEADHCNSLEALSSSSVRTASGHWSAFDLRNCFKLNHNQIRKIVEYALKEIQLRVIAWFKESNKAYGCPTGSIYYPGNEIPECFKFRSMGSSIMLELPQGGFNNKCLGFAFCAVVAFEEDHDYSGEGFDFWCEMKFKTKDDQRHVRFREHPFLLESIGFVHSDHVLVGYKLSYNTFPKDCNEVIFQFSISHYLDIDRRGVVTKCGVHLFCLQDFGKSMKDRSRSFGSTDEEENPLPKRLKY